MIKSRVTPQDTSNFCSRFPELMHKQLGRTGLTVSASGFGSYRVDYRVHEHSEAMEYALLKGINLIDTSSNYSDGGSEILIGNVIKKLIDEGKIKREEVVIVTKGGYIQGKNYNTAQMKKDEGSPYKEVVEYSKGLWHSIHPEFLKDQITDSLDRMKIEAIDVYLLHNPEYFLDSPRAKDFSIDELRNEYYRRLKRAFEYLENEAGEGRIGCYGISSNSFVKESNDLTFTSLELCLKAAEEIRSNHHFYVIQFPLNLYERGAILNKNQLSGAQTIIEFAGNNNFGILVNRPLNAITENGLSRLSDFETTNEYTRLDEVQITAEINLLESMEDDFIKEELDKLNLNEQNTEAVNFFLKAGQLFKENWKNFGSIESFNDVKKQYLIPRVNYAFSVMVVSKNITEEIKTKLDKIARQINKLISIFESIYGLEANLRANELHLKLNKLMSQNEIDRFKELRLSQKAILMINSIEEVSSTLIGMRQKKYVDDVIGCLEAQKVEDAAGIFKKLEI
ncbi:MAG: aldo/keto reductase [Ignavibacteria bacterium]